MPCIYSYTLRFSYEITSEYYEKNRVNVPVHFLCKSYIVIVLLCSLLEKLVLCADHWIWFATKSVSITSDPPRLRSMPIIVQDMVAARTKRGRASALYSKHRKELVDGG